MNNSFRSILAMNIDSIDHVNTIVSPGTLLNFKGSMVVNGFDLSSGSLIIRLAILGPVNLWRGFTHDRHIKFNGFTNRNGDLKEVLADNLGFEFLVATYKSITFGSWRTSSGNIDGLDSKIGIGIISNSNGPNPGMTVVPKLLVISLKSGQLKMICG
jgi:hypothetical protein